MGRTVDFRKKNKKPVRNVQYNKRTYGYYNYNDEKSINWVKIVFIVFFVFSVYGYIKNTGVGDFNKSQIQIDEEVYDAIYDAIADCKTSVTFVGGKANRDYIAEMYDKVIDEHPELFWASGGASFSMTGDMISKSMTFYPNYRYGFDEIPKMKKKLKKSVKSWIKGIPQDASDYEKALALHDRIVKNVIYDEETYRKYFNDEGFYDKAYNAYGCLVNKSAVCEGYSRAYQLLLQEVGIEAGVISGEATDSRGNTGGHAWNYIKLDDGYYLVDVTWDDPLGNDGTEIRHDYFCLNSVQMGLNHTADNPEEVPECNGGVYCHK